MNDNTRKMIDDYKKDLKAIVKQLEWCGYENEAGVLKMNLAFIALKELAEDGKDE
jgi:hypothetical protein